MSDGDFQSPSPPRRLKPHATLRPTPHPKCVTSGSRNGKTFSARTTSTRSFDAHLAGAQLNPIFDCKVGFSSRLELELRRVGFRPNRSAITRDKPAWRPFPRAVGGVL